MFAIKQISTTISLYTLYGKFKLQTSKQLKNKGNVSKKSPKDDPSTPSEHSPKM
jgi:hypothetical protein